MQNIEDTPVFILCGGLGTRIKEETTFRPKPMVPIGDQPILLHIMRSYAKYGFRRFVLCLGYKAEIIKAYFRDFYSLNTNFTINLRTNAIRVHPEQETLDWEVTLIDTGKLNMTGSRIAQAARYHLGNSEHFAVTYGDGLCDANLVREFEFHVSHGKVGTILGVHPPSRFGEILLNNDQVREFNEKPNLDKNWINGGYFLFSKHFVKYLSEDPSCVLERDPLVQLAKDGQLKMFKHEGFWASMDTLRDQEYLAGLVQSGHTPWL